MKFSSFGDRIEDDLKTISLSGLGKAKGDWVDESYNSPQYGYEIAIRAVQLITRPS